MASYDGVMNGDELGTVGKGGFDLDLRDHLRNAFHHIGALEQRRAETHQVLHAAAFARAFEDRRTDEGDSLGIIELQSAALAPLGEQPGGENKELVFFSRGELHQVLQMRGSTAEGRSSFHRRVKACSACSLESPR